MQILLTESEYAELRDTAKQEREKNKDTLQELCTQVCDHMPIDWGWGGHDGPKPWGCILSKQGEWYCDQCPVKDVCPSNRKHWSK